MQHFSFGLPEALENLSILRKCPGLSKIQVSSQGLFVSVGSEEMPLFEEAGVGQEPNKNKRVMASVTSTLRTIQDYFVDNYQNMSLCSDLTDTGMKTVDNIMMEVDATIASLKHADTTFCNLGTLPEYRNLKKIYTEIHESIAGEDFSSQLLIDKEGELLSEKNIADTSAKGCKECLLHMLNNISDIKKDKHYELFYINNEKGGRFYSDTILRSINKLDKELKHTTSKDPLTQSKLWEDRDICYACISILKGIQSILHIFYKEVHNVRKAPLSLSVHNSIIALMLAAKPENLMELVVSKNCGRYFLDFLFYLRKALEEIEIAKDLPFDEEKNPYTEKEHMILSEMLNNLCYALYTIELKEKGVNKILREWSQNLPHYPLSTFIEKHYEKGGEVLSSFPNGPLFKSIDLLLENEQNGCLEYQPFDPIMLGIFPQKEGVIRLTDSVLAEIIRAPCPTIQKTIDQVSITEEFYGFLKSLNYRKERCLLINLQDRLSWKEKTRCHAVEALCEQAEYAHLFHPISLPEDVDFAWCTENYGHHQGIMPFITAVHQDIMNSKSHYFLSFKENIWSFQEVKDVMMTIVEVFFSKKKNFSRYEKVLFLNILYYVSVLRLTVQLDISKIIISSKDGLDGAGAFLAGLMALITLNTDQSKLTTKDTEKLVQILTGAVLTSRDRCVFAPLVEMLVRLVTILEKKGPGYLASFAHFIGGSDWKFQ